MEILRRLSGEPPTRGEIERWQGQPPQLVLIDLSKRCNLWCDSHCGYPGQQLRREEDIALGKSVSLEFTDINILKRAYDEILEAWAPFRPAIQISADGEPLLHPQREEAICYPAQIGLEVGLTTNGTLLTGRLAEKMYWSGVRLINVSLDAATADTYGIVRPTRDRKFNYFDLVTRNIQNAVAVRNRLAQDQEIKTQVMITMIVRPETAHEREAFVQLGQKLGVDKVSFRPINTTAGLTPFLEKELAESIIVDNKGVVQSVGGVARYPCHFPFTRFSLTVHDGDSVKFVYCPHAWDRDEADIGVYPDDGSLKDLWESPRLKEIRRSHLQNEFSGNTLCGSCADWRFVTGRDQITYADIVKGKTSEIHL